MNDRRVELTVRGLILGAAITLVFTAANVYLGLKVGLTFASTIPAAIISMAVLRAFKNASIYENNIVQTVASAAGTISAIIFVLPGLVMIGWWTGFPFWESFSICAIGGTLGVMYSVPLRRALVTQSDLPYPEGVAAAEVLKVGVGSRAGADVERNRAGMFALVAGTLASAGFAAIVGTRLFAGQIAGYFRAGAAATGLGFALSLALVGAGHLIGLSVGLAILAGLVIAWGVATPLLTALAPMAGSAADVATSVWAHQVRFVGAGAIGIAAIWTLARLAKPVWGGVVSAIRASRHLAAGGPELPRTERDIPIALVAGISVLCLIP
ncbi:MAG: oligopeptide transporter, OPT family, partial [Candidatus Eremiobacteraeota bacterium]|nr:oligopeptide transporter, OPT family [Candidatus Eremiobacteraeota bacterium]